MKILHIYGKLTAGGAEIVTLEFLKRNFNKNNFTHDFLALSGEVGSLDDDFIKYGNGKVHHVKFNSFNILKLWRIIRSENYDCIHSNVYYASGLFMMIAYFAKIPLRISHFHSIGKIKISFLDKLKQLILKSIIIEFSSKIVCVSKSVYNSAFLDVSSSKIEIIYNGFSKTLPYLSDKKNKTINIGHIGSFREAKNHLFLVEIIKRTLLINSNIRFNFYGRLDEIIYPQFRELLKKEIETGLVIIHGQVSKIDEILKNKLDITINSSLWEGLPGAIIESIANGIPVIASNILPNNEVSTQLKGIYIVENWEEEQWVQAILNHVLKIERKEIDKLEIMRCFNESKFTAEYFDERILGLYSILV